MSSLTLAALLSVTSLGHVWKDYSVAYASAVRDNRELLVLITADWCGPCQRLKRQVLSSPQLQPTLQSYVCAMVNVDRQPALARALGGKGGIPLLLAYHRTERGWTRREIRGYQSAEKLKRLLHISPPPTIRQVTSMDVVKDRPDPAATRPFDRNASALPSKTTKPSHQKVQLLGIVPDVPARKQTPRRTSAVDSTGR